MAKKTSNDHAADHAASSSENHHEGSSVGFYIFIALVLGAITYLEFALVEYQDTWFTALSNLWILVLLVVLSVVKFILVVMFFMHLKGDHRTFAGFFSSGMAIAVGTLFALSALFTVRSLATAQTPQQEGAGVAEAQGQEAEEHGAEQSEQGTETEASLAHRFEYPAPKTLNVDIIDLGPRPQLVRGGANSATVQTDAGNSQTASSRPGGPPPITLPDPFAQGAGGAAGQNAAQPAAPPAGEAQAAGGAAALLVDADTSAGEGVYNGNCASCHQATGAGVPGAFPPIAGHAPELALAEGGREYLVNLLLYGLQGEIQISGQAYNGAMPAWAQFSDDELASTLNYVLSSWGNAEALPPEYAAFTADEVAAQRDAALSTAEVYELRQTLELP